MKVEAAPPTVPPVPPLTMTLDELRLKYEPNPLPPLALDTPLPPVPML